MANIKVKIIDQKTLCLEEDGHKGDIIDLNSAISIDTGFIQRLIEEEKNKLLEKRLSEQKDALTNIHKKDIENLRLEYEKERDIKIKENAKNYDEIITSLKIENKKLETKIDLESKNAKEKLNNEIAIIEASYKSKAESINLEHFKTENEQKRKIESLENELSKIKELYSKDLELEKSKIAETYKSQIEAKNNEITKFKYDIALNETKYANELLSKEKELEEKHNSELAKLKQELEETQTKYSQLSLTKSFQNVKTLGEELEKWCTQEYENAAIAGFNNCTWQKDNDVIKENGENKGTKADFIFKVFSDTPSKCAYPISSVCLEMKNESNVSTSRKKNSDYYKKLDDDRNKKGCEYALLVSELEWDTANDSPIKKVSEYEKMFVVRPQYMITFLSIIYSLSTKYSEIINAKNKEELNLKESQELIEEFEALKKTYLENPLVSLEKQINEINKNNDKIIESANRNRDLISKIITDTLATISTKIERFNIIKLAKKRDKITDQ